MTDAVTLSLTANPSELFDVIAKCENQDALAMSIGSAVMNGLLGGLHWSDAVNLSVLKITASSADQTAPSSPGDGWVMVPIVPRDEMVRAGDAVLAQSTWPDADDIWTAMIDARPLPTEGEGTNG